MLCPTPSRARKVRWIANGASSTPRVTSATIAGQMPPEGCFRPAWKRSVCGNERWRPREARYVSTGVSSVGLEAFQMESATSVRFGSSRSGCLVVASHHASVWTGASRSPATDRETAELK